MKFLTALLALIAAGCYAFWKLYIKPYPPMPSTDHLSEVILNPRDLQVPAQPQKQPVQPSSVATASSATLATFCQAITDYEGKPGSLNYQLNNPGDCRPSPVGYLPKYQPVEIIDTDTDPRYPYHKGKFAKFPTYEIGWEYLESMVHFMAVTHPTWTILDFFAHYAPTSDANAPLPYAKYVANRCGVPVNIHLAALLGGGTLT